MKPILKKALMAVAAKKAVEKVVEMRRPEKPSFLARLFKLGLFVGGAAGAAYLVRSGKAQELLGKAKGRGGDPGGIDSASNGHSGDITFRSEDQPISTPV